MLNKSTKRIEEPQYSTDPIILQFVEEDRSTLLNWREIWPDFPESRTGK